MLILEVGAQGFNAKRRPRQINGESAMSKFKPHRTVDTRGEVCPMPLLRTKKAMREMDPGEILEVVGTDPGSKNDLPGWAARTGNLFLGVEEEGDTFHFYLQKK
jgi:tRNA 2-thiouridine synthesizing protein A